MRVLFIGDVTGETAARKLARFLPAYEKQKGVDFTVINGENSSDKNGITPDSANLLFNAGADLITTGNHVFKNISCAELFGGNEFVIRPANYGTAAPGRGFAVVDFGRCKMAVANIGGNVYNLARDNPFTVIDDILDILKKDGIKMILVDFHAEATSEKQAMKYHLAGRVSALIGTHTHVQTADEHIYNNTAYITDAGMTGPEESVIGAKIETTIKQYTSYLPYKHCWADGACFVNGVLIDIDETTGAAVAIQRLQAKNI